MTNFPLQYYVIAAAVLLVVGAFVFVRLRARPRKSPRNPYIEALKLLVEGHEEGAFAKLQEAVRMGSAPTDAYIKLGNLLRERGQASKALQIHQSLTVKADLTRSEQSELYQSLAEDHARLGSSERSVKVLETAVRKLHAKDPAIFKTLARHYHVLGLHDKAYHVLKDAKKLGSLGERELALYLTSTAEAMVDEGRPKDARKVLQRALRHDPDCVPCLHVLGNIAAQADELDDAIKHWRRVAVLSPELASSVLTKLEVTLFERGRFSEIEKIYNEVRSVRISDEAASLGLAGFYRKQGRGEDAMALLEEFLTVHPDSVNAALLLTSFYARYRDSETLERFLDESVEAPARSRDFECEECSLRSPTMRWHCPRCNAFDSYSSNHHEI